MCKYKKPISSILSDFLKDDGIKILVNKTEYDQIFNWYKNNYKKYTSEIDFLDSARAEIYDAIYKSPAALAEICKQFRAKKGLQSGILSECYYSQTIAEALKLNNFLDCDNCDKNKTGSILSKIINVFNIVDSRYVYYNDNENIILCQSGSPHGFDAIFIECGCVIHIEFKENFAKLGEYDISYDDNGKLIIDNRFKDKHPESVPLAEHFNNSVGSILDIIGTNFRDFNNDTLTKTAKSYFDKLDLLFTVDSRNVVLPIPNKYLLDFFELSESELRTAGKNHYDIWTSTLFANIIKDKGGQLSGEIVKLPINSVLQSRKGRGTGSSTRIKIHQLFFIKKRR